MNQDKFLKALSKRLNEHFKVLGTETGTTRPKYNRKKDSKKVLTKTPKRGIIEPSKGMKLYESITQYTQITGKRFRLTKAEISDNLTREQAFDKRFNKS